VKKVCKSILFRLLSSKTNISELISIYAWLLQTKAGEAAKKKWGEIVMRLLFESVHCLFLYPYGHAVLVALVLNPWSTRKRFLSFYILSCYIGVSLTWVLINMSGWSTI
jgi:hypothetical protein